MLSAIRAPGRTLALDSKEATFRRITYRVAKSTRGNLIFDVSTDALRRGGYDW